MKSCFLFGHSDCPDSILPELERIVKEHYEKFGVRYFYVGNRGLFDGYAATAVKRVKSHYADIQLFLLLAYHPAERVVCLSGGFDGSYYPALEHVPRQHAIVQANRYMIDTADTLICYVRHIGNARNLLDYAKRRRKSYIDNIALTSTLRRTAKI